MLFVKVGNHGVCWFSNFVDVLRLDTTVVPSTDKVSLRVIKAWWCGAKTLFFLQVHFSGQWCEKCKTTGQYFFFPVFCCSFAITFTKWQIGCESNVRNLRERSNWIKIFSWKFGPLFLIMILKQCVVLFSKTVCSFFCNQPYFVERHFRELFCFNALLSNKTKSNHIMTCFYFLF